MHGHFVQKTLLYIKYLLIYSIGELQFQDIRKIKMELNWPLLDQICLFEFLEH